MKKADMIAAAEQYLEGCRMLPAVLRQPRAATAANDASASQVAEEA